MRGVLALPYWGLRGIELVQPGIKRTTTRTCNEFLDMCLIKLT
uniref:Uncharacterized protein n=1 Tax=Lepeophtheirus salmonis TaxID=72036 RepID=A0A0K2U344_LEPSM